MRAGDEAPEFVQVVRPDLMSAVIAATKELDAEVGIGRLAVVHANDSLMEFGSTRDRHQNIGDGHIGSEGFRVILGEPAFDGIAMLLEVPGIDGDSGPDLENVRRLKALRDG